MTATTFLLPAVSALLGALVGALTPAPAYRRSVEFGEPPLTSCGSCSAPLTLAARCRACGTRLGPSLWWTIPAGAITFGGLAWAIDSPVVLAAALVLGGLAVPLAAIDLAVLRLPDPLVLIAFIATAGLLTVASVVSGDWDALLRAGEAGVVLFGWYFLLAVLPGANLGFGDVKLGAVLGLLLGYLGWGVVLLGAVLPWLLNGPVAVILLVRKGPKAVQPFGPALLAGSLLSVIVGAFLRS